MRFSESGKIRNSVQPKRPGGIEEVLSAGGHAMLQLLVWIEEAALSVHAAPLVSQHPFAQLGLKGTGKQGMFN